MGTSGYPLNVVNKGTNIDWTYKPDFDYNFFKQNLCTRKFRRTVLATLCTYAIFL